MMDWEELATKTVEIDKKKCEALILTLSVLPEIMIHYGNSVLARIHRGYFDEADIKVEEIPVLYRGKVNLELIRNDFFRDLIFVFITMDDYEYACQLMESHICNSDCSEEELANMVLQYLGMRMICQKRFPWEIEYCLRRVIHQPESMSEIMQRYMPDEGRTEDFIGRFCIRRNHM